MDFGADIVLHSATKYLGGHGTSIAGAIVDSGRFPWDNGNFPVMTEPVATYGNLRFWDNFGEYGFATKLRVEGLRNLGGVLSPFNAFLILQGMETLPLRMEAHVANAQRVAEWLDADPRVSWVRYAGLPADPNHALAQKYLPKGPGAVFSFGVRGRARGGRGVHRPRRAVLAPGQRRRHAHARHPPRLDHAPPALHRGAGGRGRAARAGAHQRRHRGRRRHPLRPRQGARMTATWEPPGATKRRNILRARAHDRRRRRVAPTPRARANFVLTYLLSSSADYEVWPVTPNETEILGAKCYPSLADLPGKPDIVDVFRRADQLPQVAREAVEAGAGAFWMQLGLHSDEAVEIASRGRPRRRVQPLREDRARALPRRPAPRGLRHRRHLLQAHPWLRPSPSTKG